MHAKARVSEAAELPPHNCTTLIHPPTYPSSLTTTRAFLLSPQIAQERPTMADSMEGVTEGEQPQTENVEQKAIAGE